MKFQLCGKISDKKKVKSINFNKNLPINKNDQ